MPDDPRILSSFRTAARGMEAQRLAMSAAAENIANANTTRTADGNPYALKRAVHEGPGTQVNAFRDLLNQKQLAMQANDARHSGGSSLVRSVAFEGGPTTEVQEEARYRMEFDPTHPHADADGYVRYPDLNVAEEMARMISANRIYEANLSAVQAAKEMIKRTLEI